MLVIDERKASEQLFENAYKSMQESFVEANKIFLRRSFDNSLLSTSALAVIRITKEHGFLELAKQMEADYKSETGKEASIC